MLYPERLNFLEFIHLHNLIVFFSSLCLRFSVLCFSLRLAMMYLESSIDMDISLYRNGLLSKVGVTLTRRAYSHALWMSWYTHPRATVWNVLWKCMITKSISRFIFSLSACSEDRGCDVAWDKISVPPKRTESLSKARSQQGFLNPRCDRSNFLPHPLPAPTLTGRCPQSYWLGRMGVRQWPRKVHPIVTTQTSAANLGMSSACQHESTSFLLLGCFTWWLIVLWSTTTLIMYMMSYHAPKPSSLSSCDDMVTIWCISHQLTPYLLKVQKNNLGVVICFQFFFSIQTGDWAKRYTC